MTYIWDHEWYQEVLLEFECWSWDIADGKGSRLGTYVCCLEIINTIPVSLSKYSVLYDFDIVYFEIDIVNTSFEFNSKAAWAKGYAATILPTRELKL